MDRGGRAGRDLGQRTGAVKCFPILPEMMMIRSKPHNGPRGVLRVIDIVRSHLRLLSGLSEAIENPVPRTRDPGMLTHASRSAKRDRGVLRTQQVTLRVK